MPNKPPALVMQIEPFTPCPSFSCLNTLLKAYYISPDLSFLFLTPLLWEPIFILPCLPVLPPPVPPIPCYPLKVDQYHTKPLLNHSDPSSSSTSAAQQLDLQAHTHPHRKQTCRGWVCSGQGQRCWPLLLGRRAESWWWETRPLAAYSPRARNSTLSYTHAHIHLCWNFLFIYVVISIFSLYICRCECLYLLSLDTKRVKFTISALARYLFLLLSLQPLNVLEFNKTNILHNLVQIPHHSPMIMITFIVFIRWSIFWLFFKNGLVLVWWFNNGLIF